MTKEILQSEDFHISDEQVFSILRENGDDLRPYNSNVIVRFRVRRVLSNDVKCSTVRFTVFEINEFFYFYTS